MSFSQNSQNNLHAQQNQSGSSETEAKKVQILMKMKESKMYWKLKQHLFKDMKTKNPLDILSLKNIQSKAYSTGIEEQLKQLIINCANKSLKTEPIKQDPLDFINQARVKWTEIVLKHYDYTAEKLKNYKAPQASGNGQENEPSEIVYIYDEKNFFNFMINIKNTSAVSLNMSPNTLMKVNFITPYLNDLRQKYDHLLTSDNIENKNSNEYRLREKRCKTLAENEALESEIETLAQGGFTNGERVELYMKYFGIESSSFKVILLLSEPNFFIIPLLKVISVKLQNMNIQKLNKVVNYLDIRVSQQKINEVKTYYQNLIIIKHVLKQQEVADNDQFFIFQESVERITQAFLRDKEVKDKLKIYGIAVDKLSQLDLQKIPPCFVIPMKFISMLVAPLGFCSNKVDIIYMIFKEFYCNFFCYLHSISSQPNGIVFLCCIFEELMNHACNKVMNHLASINVEPLRLAFPWMYYCFIGYTTVENIFLLLDRMLGYRSLDILPIVAVGVFKIYQPDILKCRNANDLDKLFSQKIEHPFINCIKAVFS